MKTCPMKPTHARDIYLLESTITQLFTQASQKGKLTITDYCRLATQLLEQPLTEGEQDLINRLLYAIRRGRLEIVID